MTRIEGGVIREKADIFIGYEMGKFAKIGFFFIPKRYFFIPSKTISYPQLFFIP